MKKLFFSLLFFLFANLIFSSGCKQPQEKRFVVAKVGNKSLTLYDIYEDIPSQLRANLTSSEIKEYVLRWINNEVLYRESLNRKLDDSEKLQKEFEKLKKELLINELIEQTVNNQIAVSDQEIQAFYEANEDSFILTEDILHAYHMLVKTKKEADDIRERLNNKEDFVSIVKDTRYDSLNSGDWDLGYFTKDEIIPEIANIVFNLPIGSFSFPIKSDFGYHIVKVIDKQKMGEKKKLELIKDEINLKIKEQTKQKIYQRFLIQTKSNFEIETNFQLLNSVMLDSLFRKGEK